MPEAPIYQVNRTPTRDDLYRNTGLTDTQRSSVITSMRRSFKSLLNYYYPNTEADTDFVRMLRAHTLPPVRSKFDKVWNRYVLSAGRSPYQTIFPCHISHIDFMYFSGASLIRAEAIRDRPEIYYCFILAAFNLLCKINGMQPADYIIPLRQAGAAVQNSSSSNILYMPLEKYYSMYQSLHSRAVPNFWTVMMSIFEEALQYSSMSNIGFTMESRPSFRSDRSEKRLMNEYRNRKQIVPFLTKEVVASMISRSEMTREDLKRIDALLDET